MTLILSFLIALTPVAHAQYDLPPSPAEEAAACADSVAQASAFASRMAAGIAKQKHTTVVSITTEHQSAGSCGSGYYTMRFADGMGCLPLIGFAADLTGKKARVYPVSMGPNCAY